MAAGVMLIEYAAFSSWMKRDLERRIENAEQRKHSDAYTIPTEWAEHGRTIRTNLNAMMRSEDDLLTHTSLLKRSHSEWETKIRRWGNSPMADGRTVTKHYDDPTATVKEGTAEIYEHYKAPVIAGDLSWRSMREFVNNLPFDYSERLTQSWREDRPKVEEARAALSSQ